MATRQNKKRKGRNNAPPRERTVTTLTDGSDGPFLPSTPVITMSVPDEHVLSPAYPINVSPTIPGPQSPAAALPAGPYMSSFSTPFPFYSSVHMAHAPGPSFQSPIHLSGSQLYPSTSAPQSTPVQLPTGQNDLEILEKLKETIKSNQHEFFRPIPQPAALASVYLGPRSSSGPAYVPPHPEQLHTEPAPPGLSLSAQDGPKSGGAAAVATSTLPSHAPKTPDPKDDPKKLIHRSSVSESPKPNVLLTFELLRSIMHTNHPSSSQAMQPPSSPTKRSDRYDAASGPVPTSPSKQDKGDTGASQRLVTGNVDSSPRPGPLVFSRDRIGHAGELTNSPVPIPAKLPPADPKDDFRKDSPWTPRNGYEDRDRPPPSTTRSPTRNGNNNASGLNDNRGPPPRDQRPYEREKERDRDRSRDRDYDRDADRDRRADYSRYRDDRRVDDRSRPLDDRRPPNGARYESRYPLRRYDSKASESFGSGGRDDRGPDVRPPPRNLGEERAIVRPPLNTSVSSSLVPEERRGPPSSSDDRSRPPPPLPVIDDRRVPPLLRSPERQSRASEDHRSTPAPVDRLGRPDDRRPPPALTTDRPALAQDDRRRPPSPTGSDRLPPRPLDDHRPSAPVPSALPSDRSVRPGDERRPPIPSVAGERLPPSTVNEDRRPPVPPPADRPRPVEDRRPAVLEERGARAPGSAPVDSLPARPSLDDRASRPVQPDDRSTRPPVSLESRISRAPSLQERLSQPVPPRPDDRPAPRLEERLSRPANSPPSLEERLSNPATAVDARPPRAVDDRPPRPPPPPSDRPIVRPDDRTILAEPARTSSLTDRPPPHGEDRHFTPAGRFARPASPALSERGHPPPRPPYRAQSVARDEPPRSFRPLSPIPTRPPSRSDLRDLRPGPPVDHRDRDRVDPRPPYRPDPERYPPERRPSDLMDVDLPPRFNDSRPAFRRPPSPPADPYPPRAGDRDRSWVPAGEAPPYRDAEPGRRPAVDSHGYPAREWRDTDRLPYGDDLHDRSWDRSREYDRDARFTDRDAAPPPAWETREERERRGTYPPPADLPPPTRPYEQRPLSSRLTDPYPDERAYPPRDDRAPARYDPPASYSRVRPRSPSPGPGPVRRSTTASDRDDLRPPLKRARDDSFPAPAYYPPADRDEPGYAPPARLRTPPPPAGGAYYEASRYNASPGREREREREYVDAREREPGYYERRDPAGRMPPPPPRSPPPPPYGRPYGRDDRRYSLPPRG